MGFGIGLGAFADGVSKGVGLADAIYASKRQRMLDQKNDQWTDEARDQQRAEWQDQNQKSAADLDFASKANPLRLDSMQTQDDQGKVNLASSQEDLGMKRMQDQQARSIFQGQQDTAQQAQQNYDGDIAHMVQAPGAKLADGTTSQGYSYAGQTFADQKSALAAAKQANPFYTYYMTNYAPTVAQKMVAAGRPDLAQGFMNYMKDARTAQATETLGRAHSAWSMGDKIGALNLINQAANNPMISGGGVHYDFTETQGKDGKPTGFQVTSTGANGQTQSKSFDSADEMWHAVWPLVSPEQSFQTGVAQQQATDAARTDVARTQFQNNEKIRVDQAKGVIDNDRAITEGMFKVQTALARSGYNNGTQQRIAKYVNTRLQSEGGIGEFSKMTPQQQVDLAVQAIQAQDKGASAIDSGQPVQQQGAQQQGQQPSQQPPVLR